MASSSTSTSTSHTINNNDYVFDVFINHRGPDVKKTLATDLYHRLCKHDLRVFLDEQELRVGENLTPQIESAIRTSSVNIAIFSPNYAYSTWCLDELVLMVECMSKYKSTIIPVFYGVKPTELRWVEGGKGVYAQALRELQEKKDAEGGPRYDSNTLKKWKKALSDVPEIIGFDGEKYNRKMASKKAFVNLSRPKTVKGGFSKNTIERTKLELIATNLSSASNNKKISYWKKSKEVKLPTNVWYVKER